RGVELVQRVRDESAQPPLRHALRQRIDGRQGLFRWRLPAAHATVLRVDHLETLGAAAHLAEATQPRAARKALLLRGREVKEAQCQEAGTVREAALQLPASAVGDLRE